MKTVILGLAGLPPFFTAPAFAALKVGDTAPISPPPPAWAARISLSSLPMR